MAVVQLLLCASACAFARAFARISRGAPLSACGKKAAARICTLLYYSKCAGKIQVVWGFPVKKSAGDTIPLLGGDGGTEKSLKTEKTAGCKGRKIAFSKKMTKITEFYHIF